MTFLAYLEEKIWALLGFLLFTFFLIITFLLLSISKSYIFLFSCLLGGGYFLFLIIDYRRKRHQVRRLIALVDDLEEQYLIAEILQAPKEMLNYGYYYALKKACKAMNDKIGQIEQERLSYQEYIESFVHEVKTPIAALSLYADNRADFSLKKEVAKIDHLVEQILFYARSDTTEKDYFIEKLSLDELIHPVLLKYKDYILESNIHLIIKDLKFNVYTDEKWFRFIIGQIIQNAIKYHQVKDPNITITAKETACQVTLVIRDNGKGIQQADLSRVFEKGFTGTDRRKENSTGMGLYLVRKLCERLEICISINSKENRYTEVILVFPKGSLLSFN